MGQDVEAELWRQVLYIGERRCLGNILPLAGVIGGILRFGEVGGAVPQAVQLLKSTESLAHPRRGTTDPGAYNWLYADCSTASLSYKRIPVKQANVNNRPLGNLFNTNSKSNNRPLGNFSKQQFLFKVNYTGPTAVTVSNI